MIALDTQILVYAFRQDAEWHESSRDLLIDLLNGSRPWAVPWPCAHEFLVTVTRPNLYNPPSPIELAFQAVERWTQSPAFHFLHEGTEHLLVLRALALRGGILGHRLHDAKIAAICVAHGVKELWSIDRDFSRFPDLKVVNPLVK